MATEKGDGMDPGARAREKPPDDGPIGGASVEGLRGADGNGGSDAVGGRRGRP